MRNLTAWDFGGALLLPRDWPVDVEALERDVTARQGREEPTRARGRGAVARLPIYGLLTQSSEWFGTSYDRIRADLAALAGDETVSTIVLDIASPGGGLFGLLETAAALRRLRAQRRPRLVAIANPMAGSAAYWLAAQAHDVVVTPSGQIGSIGVFAMHLDQSAANERIGITPTYIVSQHAPAKVEANPDQPLSDAARAHRQGIVDRYEADFIRDVAAGRGISQATVRDRFGQGRMCLAEDAVDRGMADRVGTLEDVLADLGGEVARSREAAGWRARAQLAWLRLRAA